MYNRSRPVYILKDKVNVLIENRFSSLDGEKCRLIMNENESKNVITARERVKEKRNQYRGKTNKAEVQTERHEM